MTDPAQVEIRVVLDRSAMQSYSYGHVHVGELLVDVLDEDAYFAIPTVALTEAYAAAIDNEQEKALLDVLIALPGVVVLDLDAQAAQAMSGSVQPAKHDLAQAHAVWAAHCHKALLMTTEPHRFTGLIPADQIHPISASDA